MRPFKFLSRGDHNSSVQFLFEQDGLPEQRLKRALSLLFVDDKEILRAYLTKITYGNPKKEGVALCLYVSDWNTNPVRVEKIGSLFSKMFNIKEHMDVIFLNDESEKRVASVAEPFYSTKKE